MFAKFKYTPKDQLFKNYWQTGNILFEAQEKEIHSCLEKYISKNNIINGTDLKNDWFKISKKDIFISHSHADIDEVKAFAGWLYDKFGLESFIDCCAWGYCDDLLRKLDDKYCYSEESETYSYKLRNYTTSHVHIMLSTALAEMMSQSECVIFFNTPNSVNVGQEILKIEKDVTTFSPWIYYELLMTQLLEKKRPERTYKMDESMCYAMYVPKISYDIGKLLNGMLTLTDEHLIALLEAWSKMGNKNSKRVLDKLYEIVSSTRLT